MAKRTRPKHREPIAETAGEHLVEDVPVFPPALAVGDAIASIAGREHAWAEAVFVVDDAGRPLGLVPLPRLLASPRESELRYAMVDLPAAAGLDMDQEHVATLARRHRMSAVPVVNGDGALAGVVPALALIDVLRREHEEDMSRLAGIRHSTRSIRQALELPPWRRAQNRLPWLLVGLAGSMVAAGVVGGFEAELQRHVAVAFFMPAIVYLADAIGTQTETVAVRGLSLGHLPLGRLLAGEVATGVIIGAVLAALAWAIVWIGWGDGRLALAVALAIWGAGSVATSAGLVLPWLLSSRGFDAAYGSGPLATVIQDVLSLVIYLAIVVVVL